MTGIQLQKAFTSFFLGPDGFFQHPGNVGGGRTVAAVCREVLNHSDPILFETFQDWDRGDKLQTNQGQPVNALEISRVLLRLGQWEGAWAVAAVHYDQLQKQEAVKKARLHKGHPACGLAILGHELGSPCLCRHYAMLSSAGDIYEEHIDKTLKHGGLGPTLLERFESNELHSEWRGKIRQAMSRFPRRTPLYLEAFLAGEWFGSHSGHIHSLAKVSSAGGIPFTEVLLNAVEKPQKTASAITGTRFEAAAGLALATTPGFEVDSARKTADEQIDLVVRYVPDRVGDLGLETGFGLVECKSSGSAVGVSDLRDFGAKCQFHRVPFGILVARAGITKGLAKFTDSRNAELVRRRFQVDGLTLLVVDISHLRRRSSELRGLQDALKADYRRLVFGDIP